MSATTYAFAFGAAFGGLSNVESLGKMRYAYGIIGIVWMVLALFNGGHSL